MRWVRVVLMYTWCDVMCVCLCVCAFQTGLTFSYFKLTLPGVGGWQCRGRTEVICRSDPLSQLWHGAAELTGLCYPRPYLVFGFPPSLFSARMALYDICPSAFSQINTTRWARNGLERQRLCSRVIQWGAADGIIGKSGHRSTMVENKSGFMDNYNNMRFALFLSNPIQQPCSMVID